MKENDSVKEIQCIRMVAFPFGFQHSTGARILNSNTPVTLIGAYKRRHQLRGAETK